MTHRLDKKVLWVCVCVCVEQSAHCAGFIVFHLFRVSRTVVLLRSILAIREKTEWSEWVIYEDACGFIIHAHRYLILAYTKGVKHMLRLSICANSPSPDWPLPLLIFAIIIIFIIRACLTGSLCVMWANVYLLSLKVTVERATFTFNSPNLCKPASWDDSFWSDLIEADWQNQTTNPQPSSYPDENLAEFCLVHRHDITFPRLSTHHSNTRT